MRIGMVASVVALLGVQEAAAQEDQELPPGPNVELVQANCTACHSPGMILTQPKLTRATWVAEVAKMRQVYKAPVAEADVEPIVAYLAEMVVPK